MNFIPFETWIETAPGWITALPEGLQNFIFQIYQTFVFDSRWEYFTDGLKITFIVTLGALAIGVVIGMIVAIIRSSHDSVRGKPNFFLRILNAICKVYITVMRGTPLLVQLFIMYFVVMVPKTNSETMFCGILTLGINSGAYVAEIARSGIMSINQGQMEAGRSLGLNYVKTMTYIILPQAFKNILPALGNELIALLKETSLVSVITLQDVTLGAKIVTSLTYDALVPYLSLALIYLVLVMALTKLLAILERRLRKGDKR